MCFLIHLKMIHIHTNIWSVPPHNPHAEFQKNCWSVTLMDRLAYGGDFNQIKFFGFVNHWPKNHVNRTKQADQRIDFRKQKRYISGDATQYSSSCLFEFTLQCSNLCIKIPKFLLLPFHWIHDSLQFHHCGPAFLLRTRDDRCWLDCVADVMSSSRDPIIFANDSLCRLALVVSSKRRCNGKHGTVYSME